ncbi:MAG TPA: ATP-binding cassette domain-containing protein [Skermanella sp.]|nr:ATP-binding cassette domain-containing protein [Skermanella sp.]
MIAGSGDGMGMAGRLELSGVGISLHGRVLVPPLSLTIDGGRVAVLMGPSGSGKSSLLAHLCGTLDPVFETVGRATLGGVDLEGLPPERRRVGILFQDDLLLPHLSVAENLAFGLPAEVRGTTGRMLVVERALEDADLGGLGGRDPATLSGGQRARVALMRTLLAEPAALLLDEPFSKLDVALRARFRAWVFDHARRRGLPTLLVTHDPADGAEADGPVIELR